MIGEDVRQLQAELQQAGFDPGDVDGIFGASTDAAVRQFQQAKGLTVDGAVGPITLAALAQALGAGTSGASKGIGLHIGLNHVDASAYPGYRIPVLRGCVNDANDMQAQAKNRGFETSQLLDDQATSAAVISAISDAAKALRGGDIFLLTYSGHGSQVPDIDNDETDGLDETWVLYDRQLLDDELYALWGQFERDVRILVISDSCHSGTITRELIRATGNQINRMRGLQPPEGLFMTPAQLDLTVSLASTVRPVFESLGGPGLAVDELTAQVVAPLLDKIGSPESNGRDVSDYESRLLPVEISVADFERRGKVYRAAKAMTRGAVPPSASVLLLSGCQDNQTSLDGIRNGLFTQNLLSVLATNPTSYTGLYRSVVSSMPPSQTPNLYWVPSPNPVFEAQAPLTI